MCKALRLIITGGLFRLGQVEDHGASVLADRQHVAVLVVESPRLLDGRALPLSDVAAALLALLACVAPKVVVPADGDGVLTPRVDDELPRTGVTQLQVVRPGLVGLGHMFLPSSHPGYITERTTRSSSRLLEFLGNYKDIITSVQQKNNS